MNTPSMQWKKCLDTFLNMVNSQQILSRFSADSQQILSKFSADSYLNFECCPLPSRPPSPTISTPCSEICSSCSSVIWLSSSIVDCVCTLTRVGRGSHSPSLIVGSYLGTVWFWKILNLSGLGRPRNGSRNFLSVCHFSLPSSKLGREKALRLSNHLQRLPCQGVFA